MDERWTDNDGNLIRGRVTERRTSRYCYRKISSNVSASAHILRLPTELDLETGEILYPYQVLKTGEKKYCSVSSSRKENIRGIRERCNDAKWVIRANEHNARLFVTLTYAENMTDTKRLYQDVRKFVAKLRRVKNGLEFIETFEPQERGAWHAHIIVLANRPLFIPNKLIQRLWWHGFTKTQGLKRIKCVSNYVASYITDLDGKKGARLELYPPRFRFIRWTEGVLKASKTSWVGLGWSLPSGFTLDQLLFDHQNQIELEREDGSVFTLTTRYIMFDRSLDP